MTTQSPTPGLALWSPFKLPGNRNLDSIFSRSDGVQRHLVTKAMTFTSTVKAFSCLFLVVTFVALAGKAGAQQLSVNTIGANGPVPSGGVISFLSPTLVTNESNGSVVITVQRTGDTTQSVTVHYETADHSESIGVFPCATINGIASSRCDYTTAIGTLTFAVGQSSKTFKVLITQDSYVEGLEGVQVTLSNPTNGAVLGTPATATLEISDDPIEPNANVIDNPTDFVTQHYHDFLNREPDPAGLAFWVNEITSCGADMQCVDVKRINVSAAFFLSIEFQETGFLVYRVYKAAYSNLPNAPVPLRFNEYLPDAQQISQGVQVGIGDWEGKLEANKFAYLSDFISRARFTSAYPTSLTPTQFVDMLFFNTGINPLPIERQAAIDEFGGAPDSADVLARVRALRRIAENIALQKLEFNRAFVLTEYFGYLRRNPDATPDTNYDGWQFWLNKLDQFDGDFVKAEMVKAFIHSGEYRSRFGQP